MKWQKIRQLHPQKWVLVEAIEAQTISDQVVVDELTIIGVFDKWESAWTGYKRLHHQDKWREYYCVSTERENLDIGVMDTFGRLSSE